MSGLFRTVRRRLRAEDVEAVPLGHHGLGVGVYNGLGVPAARRARLLSQDAGQCLVPPRSSLLEPPAAIDPGVPAVPGAPPFVAVDPGGGSGGGEILGDPGPEDPDHGGGEIPGAPEPEDPHHHRARTDMVFTAPIGGPQVVRSNTWRRLPFHGNPLHEPWLGGLSEDYLARFEVPAEPPLPPGVTRDVWCHPFPVWICLGHTWDLDFLVTSKFQEKPDGPPVGVTGRVGVLWSDWCRVDAYQAWSTAALQYFFPTEPGAPGAVHGASGSSMGACGSSGPPPDTVPLPGRLVAPVVAMPRTRSRKWALGALLGSFVEPKQEAVDPVDPPTRNRKVMRRYHHKAPET